AAIGDAEAERGHGGQGDDERGEGERGAGERGDEERAHQARADGLRARPLHTATVSEALPARLRGLRALTLTAREPGASAPAHHHLPTDTPANLDPDALQRARDFALALIAALDHQEPVDGS